MMSYTTKHIVSASTAPLRAAPDRSAELDDEAFHGMTLLSRDVGGGWFHVRTPYNYEGYVHKDHINSDKITLERYANEPLSAIISAFADVMAAPSFKSVVLCTLVRGAIAAASQKAAPEGWRAVLLAEGREGFVRASQLAPYPFVRETDEAWLRKRLVSAALSYMGAPYRWGGKTPRGIDCSGLVWASYYLNGVSVYRDARLMPGFAVKEIDTSRVAAGDLLYFDGHVAMYLGDGRYIHSTGRAGDNGVTLNSLDERDARYRDDLFRSLYAAGSIF